MRLIHAAEEFRDTGRIEQARTLYNAVLVLHPDEEFATLGLGVCTRREGKHEEALNYYHRAQQLYPTSIWPYIEAAEDYFILHRYDEAEAAWKAVLDLHPGELHALKGLVRLYRLRNDTEGALSVLNILEDQGGETMLERAKLQVELHRFSDALAQLREGAAKFPNNPIFLVEIAAILRMQGDLVTAREMLEQAVARDPLNPIGLLRLSDMARQAHDLRAALQYLDRAKKDCAPDLWVDLCAGQVQFELGHYAQSEERLREAAQTYPNHPSIALVRAELLAKRGIMSQARAVNAEAHASNLADFPLALQAAELANQLGDPTAAEATLLQLAPIDVTGRAGQSFLQGTIAEESWNLAKARSYYDVAMDLQPSHRGVVVAQLRLALLEGNLTLAKERLEHFARLEMPDRKVRGLSANVSQSFFGQLVEEFQLQPDAVAKIREAQAEPLPERLIKLAELAREYEDWTPTAMALLLALRHAGLLDVETDDKQEVNPAIPQRIFQYWHTPNVPPDVVDLMQSWRLAHPNWRYDLFDDAKAHIWFKDNAPGALPAYVGAQEKAQKSDILRLAVLNVEGGWYVDADDRCLGQLNSMAPTSARFVSYQEEYGTLGNNVLGAAPGQPVIAKALENAVTALVRGDRDTIWLSTGPGMLSRSFVQVLPTDTTEWPTYLREIAILSKPSLRRVVATHCHARYKFSGEHWSDTSFQG